MRLLHRRRIVLCALSILPVVAGFGAAPEQRSCDICVFGATSAGVAAAVQASRSGRKVILIEPGGRVGGLSSCGQDWRDVPNTQAVGGLAREFCLRMGQHYGTDEAWAFEPGAAESLFREMLRDARVPVLFHERLKSVETNGARIAGLDFADGKTIRAKIFIDASYEGDLMAGAGVTWTSGREANSAYSETLNGIRGSTAGNQFTMDVDPYLHPGDSRGGLLPLIEDQSFGSEGQGDKAVPADEFILCLTRDPANRLPIEPPAHYDVRQYELLARYLSDLASAGTSARLDPLLQFAALPNGKAEVSNKGAVSMECIGESAGYLTASPAERERIRQAHEDYTRGLLRFLADDSRVPDALRAEVRQWGLCKDEFKETDGWTPQLDVAEGRRMVSDYIMTENNGRYSLEAPDSVGVSSYGLHSENCRRIVRDGRVENEGDFEANGFSPYPISYRCLTPRAGECENLLVPVCLSASHAACASLRAEPVLMILGQSAGLAAAVAVEDGVAVQGVKYRELGARLAGAGQILDWPLIAAH